MSFFYFENGSFNFQERDVNDWEPRPVAGLLGKLPKVTGAKGMGIVSIQSLFDNRLLIESFCFRYDSSFPIFYFCK